MADCFLRPRLLLAWPAQLSSQAHRLLSQELPSRYHSLLEYLQSTDFASKYPSAGASSAQPRPSGCVHTLPAPSWSFSALLAQLAQQLTDPIYVGQSALGSTASLSASVELWPLQSWQALSHAQSCGIRWPSPSKRSIRAGHQSLLKLFTTQSPGAYQTDA